MYTCTYIGHFYYISVSVESTGILAPEVLVSQAIQVLIAKVRDVKRELDAYK